MTGTKRTVDGTMRTTGTKGRSMENITWNNENKDRNKENNGYNNEEQWEQWEQRVEQ